MLYFNLTYFALIYVTYVSYKKNQIPQTYAIKVLTESTSLVLFLFYYTMVLRGKKIKFDIEGHEFSDQPSKLMAKYWQVEYFKRINGVLKNGLAGVYGLYTVDLIRNYTANDLSWIQIVFCALNLSYLVLRIVIKCVW